MVQGINTIVPSSKFGSVNCYHVKTNDGFVPIDTGWSTQLSNLENELERMDCQVENLKLILLTHGDFDHIGNCPYLCQKFSTPIARHFGDS